MVKAYVDKEVYSPTTQGAISPLQFANGIVTKADEARFAKVLKDYGLTVTVRRIGVSQLEISGNFDDGNLAEALIPASYYPITGINQGHYVYFEANDI